jgi:DNA-binding transcriptional LysR family regulator
MLDFDLLRTLVVVADHGSMSGAAVALCCTQPAVSRKIAALERKSGAALVVRTHTGTRLTAAGELLVGHARSMVNRLACAERHLAGLTRSGQIRIGSFSSANIALAPRAILEFARRNPSTPSPLLQTTDPAMHLSALRAGQLDLALVTEWDLSRQNLDGVELVLLTEDEFLLAMPAGHSLARGQVRLADLDEETWIEGAHPDCLGPFARMFGLCQRPEGWLECDEWTCKLGLVAAGSGVTLFPTMALPGTRGDIVLRRLADEVLRRRIYLAYPAGGRGVPSVASMIDIFREVAVTGSRRQDQWQQQ